MVTIELSPGLCVRLYMRVVEGEVREGRDFNFVEESDVLRVVEEEVEESGVLMVVEGEVEELKV